MSYAALLTQTCTIRRATYPSEDDWNRPEASWADLATNVACRFSYAKGREVTDEAKQVVTKSDRLYLLQGTDITERDRVVLDETAYEVVFVGQAVGRSSQRVMFADLQRVT